MKSGEGESNSENTAPPVRFRWGVFIAIVGGTMFFLHRVQPLASWGMGLALSVVVHGALGIVVAMGAVRALRHFLPDTSAVDGDWFMDLKHVRSEQEAHRVCHQLQRAGIQAKAGGSNYAAHGFRFRSAGPKVLVRRRDVPKARVVLDRLFAKGKRKGK
jgi:hypothetical protein